LEDGSEVDGGIEKGSGEKVSSPGERGDPERSVTGTRNEAEDGDHDGGRAEVGSVSGGEDGDEGPGLSDGKDNGDRNETEEKRPPEPGSGSEPETRKEEEGQVQKADNEVRSEPGENGGGKESAEKVSEERADKDPTGYAEVKKDMGEETENIAPPLEPNVFEDRLDQAPSYEGLPSREKIVSGLLEKHTRLIEEYKKELEGDLTVPEGLLRARGEEERERDRINEEVARLKEERTRLKTENKKLTREFFDLISKEERLREHKKEVDMYSRFLSDVEWKLETEAIDLDTEKRLIVDLKDAMAKMRSITDGYTPDEIRNRLTGIDESIQGNLQAIEDAHHRMLEKVQESNRHHEVFVESSRKVRDLEGRKKWLERRTLLHEEMIKFWSDQMAGAKRVDEEEAKRTLRQIRDAHMEAQEKGLAGGSKVDKKEKETGKVGGAGGTSDDVKARKGGGKGLSKGRDGKARRSAVKTDPEEKVSGKEAEKEPCDSPSGGGSVEKDGPGGGDVPGPPDAGTEGAGEGGKEDEKKQADQFENEPLDENVDRAGCEGIDDARNDVVRTEEGLENKEKEGEVE